LFRTSLTTGGKPSAARDHIEGDGHPATGSGRRGLELRATGVNGNQSFKISSRFPENGLAFGF
jgi:hypothetical protein